MPAKNELRERIGKEIHDIVESEIERTRERKYRFFRRDGGRVLCESIATEKIIAAVREKVKGMSTISDNEGDDWVKVSDLLRELGEGER